MATVSISQQNVLADLQVFIASLLPDIPIQIGPVNRIPEARDENHITLTPIRRKRLDTNSDQIGDIKFQGSISDTVLTVKAFFIGGPKFNTLGTPIFGVGVMPGTIILNQISGFPLGIGTYRLTKAQSFALGILSAGNRSMTESVEWVVWADVYGADANDNATIIETAFRDQYATELFAAEGHGVQPLFADEAFQLPLVNEQEQYENRWTVQLHLQYNPTVIVPQQYADKAEVTTVDVDVVYPPSL